MLFQPSSAKERYVTGLIKTNRRIGWNCFRITPYAKSNTSQDWFFLRSLVKIIIHWIFETWNDFPVSPYQLNEKDLSIMQMVIHLLHSPYLDVFALQREHFPNILSHAAVTYRGGEGGGKGTSLGSWDSM